MIEFLEPLYIPHVGSYATGDCADLSEGMERQLVRSGKARWDGDPPYPMPLTNETMLINHDEDIRGIRAVLRDMPYAPGNDIWGLADYYPSYERLAREANPSTIFEIGTHHGNSLISLVSGAENCTKIGWLEINPTASEACRMNLAYFLEALGRQAEVWIENDRRSVSRFGRADLVHVDGDHTHEGAAVDLKLCAEILRPKWLLVDDYDYPGVQSAVDEFARTYGKPDKTISRATRDHINILVLWNGIKW